MSKADAKRVAALHKEEFGVDGCIGCLDWMHACWRTCPVAWQDQCDGKEGNCSIVWRLWRTTMHGFGTRSLVPLAR